MNHSILLQRALFLALSDNYMVYEVIPKKFEFPFITIPTLNREENLTKTDLHRFNFLVSIDGWTKGKSSTESKDVEHYIYEQIKNIKLKEQNTSEDEDGNEIQFFIENVSLEMNTTIKEQDANGDIIFHSVNEFLITTNEKEI